MRFCSAIGVILSVNAVFTGCSNDTTEVTSSQPTNSSIPANDAEADSQALLASGDGASAPLVLSNYAPIGVSAPEVKAVSANVLSDRLNVKFVCSNSNGFEGASKASFSCGGVPLKEIRFGLVQQENMISAVNEAWLAQTFDPTQVPAWRLADCKNFCAGNFKTLESYPNMVSKQGQLIVGFSGVIDPTKVYMYAVEYRRAYQFGFIRFNNGVNVSAPIQTRFDKVKISPESTVFPQQGFFASFSVNGLMSVGSKLLVMFDNCSGGTSFCPTVKIYESLKRAWIESSPSLNNADIFGKNNRAFPLAMSMGGKAHFTSTTYPQGYMTYDSSYNSWVTRKGQFADRLVGDPVIVGQTALFLNRDVNYGDSYFAFNFETNSVDRNYYNITSQSCPLGECQHSVLADSKIFRFPRFEKVNGVFGPEPICNIKMQVIDTRVVGRAIELIDFPAKGIWEKKTLSCRYNAGAAQLFTSGSKLFVLFQTRTSFDVYSKEGTYYNELFAYDIMKNSWSKIPTPVDSVLIGRAFAWKNFLFLPSTDKAFAGIQMNILDLDTNRWARDYLENYVEHGLVSLGNQLFFGTSKDGAVMSYEYKN